LFITVMVRRAAPKLLAAETSLRPAEDLRAFPIAFEVEIAGCEARWALAT